MNRLYERINWENEPSIRTPLNDINLNKMDYVLSELDTRVVNLDSNKANIDAVEELQATKANQSDTLLLIKDVEYNKDTGVFVFTKYNGTSISVDLNIEKIPVSFSMSDGVITMITDDGTEYTADVGTLIKNYTFDDSDTITFATTVDTSGNKTITAQVLAGSITKDHLQPDYLGELETQAAKAETNANTAVENAGYAKAYSETAEHYKDDAESASVVAKSYAVGGTGSRELEDYDNAKTYSNQAKIQASIAGDNAEQALSARNDAESFATDAQNSASSASFSMSETIRYTNLAESFENSAHSSAILADKVATRVQEMSRTSESWAIGGTGSRTGEDTDNSMYYSRESRAHAMAAEFNAAEALESKNFAEFYRDESKSIEVSVKSIFENIDTMLSLPIFEVDLITGNLLYIQDTNVYNFSINNDGNLVWEVR